MSRQQRVLAGCAAIVIGSWWLHTAYEGSGKPRPFPLRFLPG